MKYRSTSGFTVFVIFLVLELFIVGCQSPQVPTRNIDVSILTEGKTRQVSLPAGSTVAEAIKKAGLTPGNLDRIEPPYYTVLSEGDNIKLIRINEVYKTEERIIPYKHQVIRNESLAEGETRLIQPGINGIQEITYRQTIEDDEETNNSIVKTVIIKTPVPEIMMVGVQAAFAPIPIQGRLIYLAGGNAWIMEGSTTNRRPLITSGDLDGYIFTESPQGDWLLFTRKSNQSPDLERNTLWVVSTSGTSPQIIDLKVSNVVHYAGWWPGGGTKVVYSTVESRPTPPGWQANNDLYQVTFGSGWVSKPTRIVESNSGGVYGWWGMTFAWSENGQYLAYSRPDEIGLVDVNTGTLVPLMEITPLQTHSDWAWFPAIAWGSDDRTLCSVTHAPSTGLVSPEESPHFDLNCISLVNNSSVRIAQETGMFAYVSPSPLQIIGREKNYQIAYLQAVFPAQSETSRYRLVIMDRDGSNKKVIFPPEDAEGLEPRVPVWSPQSSAGQSENMLAIIYQGNLWLIVPASGQTQQITGDGLIKRIDWK